MASIKERLQAARDRYPWLDHTLSMNEHYGNVNGNSQAGAVTYFGFLSFFPILALAFFVVGIIAAVYPDARDQLTKTLSELLPGIIGGDNGVKLSSVQQFKGLAGVVGLLGVAYSGLGWLSGLRVALEVMFELPSREQPNFVIGKLRDLVTLALVGFTLILSVALSGAVTSFSKSILGVVGIDSGSFLPALLLSVLGHLLGIAASTVLLLTMFKLLVARSHLPRNALVRGAVLGAVLFEILKLFANLLLSSATKAPGFASFGVALVLLVWINYFSRIVMYAAAWAYTSPDSVELRLKESRRAPGAAVAEGVSVDTSALAGAGAGPAPARRPWRVAVVAAAVGAAAVAAVRGGRG